MVKSARRVFEILEFFAMTRRPCRALDIAASLMYPASSTAALLKTMTHRGYLSYEQRSHTYFPTVRLYHVTARLHGLLRPLEAEAPIDGHFTAEALEP